MRNNYPRPQLVRNSFHSLNGVWKMNHQNIDVPSCLQESHMHYEKEFNFKKTNDRVILHFEKVDQIANVFINNHYLGMHEGGYLPFEFEITSYIKQGKNILVVDVLDELDITYPYGKQTNKPGGMWYTKVSGIYSDVWYEEVPKTFIKSISIKPDLKGVDLKIYIDSNGRLINKHKRIDIKNPILWSLDNPHLYHSRIKEDKDEVEIYYGLRTISIKKIDGINRLCLNNKPIILNGLLDQGYYKGSLFIQSKNGYRKDILNIKELGFNTLRKHIKVESEQFYYECDRNGILVIQDMVENGKYSFIRDTALPTIGINRNDRVDTLNNSQKFFIKHSKDTIKHLYNHPCIIIYTIFNEGWGQFNSDELYKEFKKLDKTRLYDSTSGWFKQRDSDFDSEHVYFRNKNLIIKNRPFLLSECGGYVYNINNDKVRWGYGICHSKEELTDRIIEMYEKMVIPNIKKGLCGVIYTQLSDVEEEINGLYTYDRKILKVNRNRLFEEFKKISI